MSHNNLVPVITLDGPSGTGKGTLCHLLAKRLGWHFLDSGALYRVLAHAAGIHGVSLDDAVRLAALAHALNLRFEIFPQQRLLVMLDDKEISADIRTEACSQTASKIAVIPEVRKALLSRQRNFAEFPGLVTDGRDMGTVVFPDALLKIFLIASPEERAQRRYLQLKESGNDVRLAQVLDELIKRDSRDTARTHAPLKPAWDAVELDTSGLSIEQVFNKVMVLVEHRLA